METKAELAKALHWVSKTEDNIIEQILDSFLHSLNPEILRIVERTEQECRGRIRLRYLEVLVYSKRITGNTELQIEFMLVIVRNLEFEGNHLLKSGRVEDSLKKLTEQIDRVMGLHHT